jgi:putative SOS response-associated peptidase YedK
VPQVAPLTRAPNADVAPIHDRMPVLLDPSDIATWLTGIPGQASALAGPWPDGRLAIAPAAP